VAEFSVFVYDARTGAPLGVVQPMAGEYPIRNHTMLMIIARGQQSAAPGETDPGVSWTAFQGETHRPVTPGPVPGVHGGVTHRQAWFSRSARDIHRSRLAARWAPGTSPGVTTPFSPT